LKLYQLPLSDDGGWVSGCVSFSFGETWRQGKEAGCGGRISPVSFSIFQHAERNLRGNLPPVPMPVTERHSNKFIPNFPIKFIFSSDYFRIPRGVGESIQAVVTVFGGSQRI
jgi:hypothetical protein